MKKTVLTMLLVGILIAVVGAILSIASHDSRWTIGGVILGVIFLFASGTALYSPAGDGGMGIITRRYFKEMYRDKPELIRRQSKISNKAAISCLCIGAPNVIIPIIVAVIQHGA